MQLVEVIPLTKLDQSYTFFCHLPVNKFSLVLVPFRGKNQKGLVLRVQEFNKLKIRKGLPYSLRCVKKVLVYKPQLQKVQFSLAEWISNYYLEPLGIVLKVMLHRGGSRFTRKMILKPEKGLWNKLFNFSRKLQKIIIYDEINDLYKSQSAPRFDVRKVTQKIAELTNARIEIKRPDLKKTEIRIIDMRGRKEIVSVELQEEIKKAKSYYLVLNRLGRATLINCQDCGFIKKCQNCDAPMVYHENLKELLCHHCVFKDKPSDFCEKCKGTNLRYLGKGIETLKDYKATTMKNKLPKAQLIGVVSVDHILNLPDFRAAEKVYYSLLKLNNLTDKLVIQTYHPNHYVFNFKEFLKTELKIRREFDLPPYSSLIKLIYKNKNPYRAKTEAFRMFSIAKPFLGPAPAFIPRKRGFYHWNLVYKSSPLLKKILRKLKLPKGWIIDVDPVDLL